MKNPTDKIKYTMKMLLILSYKYFFIYQPFIVPTRLTQSFMGTDKNTSKFKFKRDNTIL